VRDDGRMDRALWDKIGLLRGIAARRPPAASWGRIAPDGNLIAHNVEAARTSLIGGAAAISVRWCNMETATKLL